MDQPIDTTPLERAARIAEAIRESGRSQAEIARLCGVSATAVGKWIRDGKISDKNRLKISFLSGLNSLWIRDGKPPRKAWFKSTTFQNEAIEAMELGPDAYDDWAGQSVDIDPPSPLTEVPLISWVQAGNWMEIVDSFEPGDADRWIAVQQPVSGMAYALEITGDSMVNARGLPSFPEGTIIIVDPMRPLRNRDLIIARIDEAEKATFKQYVEDGSQKYLRALNPDYKPLPIDSPMTYCGRVVAVAEMAVSDT